HRLILAALALVSAAALGSCHKPIQLTPKQQARAVTVAIVAPRMLVGGLTASGQLVPRLDVTIFPEITGYRVTQLFVDAGSWVKSGQPLAQIDTTLLKDASDQAAALAAQQKVMAEQAQSQATRVKGALAQGLLSTEQIQTRRFASKSAQAQYQAEEAVARDAAQKVALATVRAPCDGLVIERNIRVGDLTAGTNPWFRIAKDGVIELQAQVSGEDLDKLRVGDKARVSLSDGKSAIGDIRLISPNIDPNTDLGWVRITLPVRSDIRSGGYAKATFLNATRSALTVPETAVRYDANGASVMVVGSDDRLVQVPVTTGQRAGGFVELVTGPPSGSRVVAMAGALFTPGDYVRIAFIAPPPASSGSP
ncbi:MAG: efflux RND transporter periplasmic adaptor subunit, partial [Caulobacteraceae bacterium]